MTQVRHLTWAGSQRRGQRSGWSLSLSAESWWLIFVLSWQSCRVCVCVCVPVSVSSSECSKFCSSCQTTYVSACLRVLTLWWWTQTALTAGFPRSAGLCVGVCVCAGNSCSPALHSEVRERQGWATAVAQGLVGTLTWTWSMRGKDGRLRETGEDEL